MVFENHKHPGSKKNAGNDLTAMHAIFVIASYVKKTFRQHLMFYATAFKKISMLNIEF